MSNVGIIKINMKQYRKQVKLSVEFIHLDNTINKFGGEFMTLNGDLYRNWLDSMGIEYEWFDEID